MKINIQHKEFKTGSIVSAAIGLYQVPVISKKGLRFARRPRISVLVQYAKYKLPYLLTLLQFIKVVFKRRLPV